jgi:major membrane immunogen (membrane-anchored lipoprotein)
MVYNNIAKKRRIYMRRLIAAILAVMLLGLMFSACGGKGAASYKDGSYAAKSQPNALGYAEIKIEVKGGKITAADFKEYEAPGKEKGPDYGKGSNAMAYKAAQKSIVGSRTYGKKLLETQDASKVDAVSGATLSYSLFVRLAQEALAKAKN